jgi:hypothetical protein
MRRKERGREEEKGEGQFPPLCLSAKNQERKEREKKKE